MPSTDPRTFLIADDSHDKIVMLKHFLKVAGWQGQTLIAETSEQAASLLKKHTIDFAFVDYYIPSTNGPSIIRSLKTAFPSCRIALVSSAENARNFAEAKAAGAEGTICSTHRSDEVEKAFRSLLEDWIRGEQ